MKHIKKFEANKNKEHPFLQAAKNGSSSKVKYFIKKGVDVNMVDIEGRTALMLASWNSYLIIVKLLVDSADVNMVNIEGRTALMMASTPKIINLLLDAGANVNIKNNRNENVVMSWLNYLQSIIKLPIFEKIIKNGLDLDADNGHGQNFYDMLKNKKTPLIEIEQYIDEHFPQYKDKWEMNQNVNKYNL